MKGDIDDLVGDTQRQLDKVHDLIESITNEYNIPTSTTQQIYNLLRDINRNLDSIAAQADDMIRRPYY